MAKLIKKAYNEDAVVSMKEALNKFKTASSNLTDGLTSLDEAGAKVHFADNDYLNDLKSIATEVDVRCLGLISEIESIIIYFNSIED